MMLCGEIRQRWQTVGTAHGLLLDSEIADYLLRFYEQATEKRNSFGDSDRCATCQTSLTLICLTCTVAAASGVHCQTTLQKTFKGAGENVSISGPVNSNRGEEKDFDTYFDCTPHTEKSSVKKRRQRGRPSKHGTTPPELRKIERPVRHLQQRQTPWKVGHPRNEGPEQITKPESKKVGHPRKVCTADSELKLNTENVNGHETDADNLKKDFLSFAIKTEDVEVSEFNINDLEGLDLKNNEQTADRKPYSTNTTGKVGRPRGRKSDKFKLQPLLADDEDKKRPFRCPLCLKHFKARIYCIEHMKTHNDSNLTHTCEFCSVKFHTSRILRQHLRKHKVEKPVNCEICNKTLSSEEVLISHRRIHTGELPYECDQCGTKFRQNSNLAAHRRSAHATERPFSCTVCSSVFVTKAHLKSHVHSHTEHRPFLCEDCGSAFKTKGNLKVHGLTHTNSRHVPCPLCEQKFYNKAQLRKHLRSAVHYNVRDIVCSICGARFNRQSSLNKHMMGHTGVRPAKCEECGKGFRTTNLLKVHQRIHTGERPVICDVCGLGFQTRGNMKKHRNNIHKDATPLPPYVPQRPNKLPQIQGDLILPVRGNQTEPPHDLCISVPERPIEDTKQMELDNSREITQMKQILNQPVNLISDMSLHRQLLNELQHL